MPEQELLKDNIKCHCTLFFLNNKIVNNYGPNNYADNNNVNNNMFTQY